jgi:phosphinothricin acetyltransferase
MKDTSSMSNTTAKMSALSIRPALPDDGDAIVEIYNPYVLNTCITFEEQRVTAQEMAERIRAVQDAGLPWLVAEEEGRVIGYAYATKWKARSAYRYSVESTVYLSPAAAGKGCGTRLYAELIAFLRKGNCHAIMGGIVQPNEASVALHEKLGFRKVAHFPEVGFKMNRWLDVGYWQLIL